MCHDTDVEGHNFNRGIRASITLATETIIIMIITVIGFLGMKCVVKAAT